MHASDSTESFWSALLRAFWMLLGHAASIVLALSIAAQPSWSIGWRDILYLLCIASVIATRWLDVLHYGGTTGTGDPVTRPMLVRWSTAVLLCFGATWLVAQSIRF